VETESQRVKEELEIQEKTHNEKGGLRPKKTKKRPARGKRLKNGK
jgi:hypothetical protein